MSNKNKNKKMFVTSGIYNFQGIIMSVLDSFHWMSEFVETGNVDWETF